MDKATKLMPQTKSKLTSKSKYKQNNRLELNISKNKISEVSKSKDLRKAQK